MAVDHTMSVLIVDDYKTMIRIIGNLLKQLGFANVDEAGDGLEHGANDRLRVAAGSARRRPPVAHALHHGDGGVEDRERDCSKEAGVNNYIVKPFNAATLKAKIDAIFGE
jgi:two-component system chemotaxis response regulator CheY